MQFKLFGRTFSFFAEERQIEKAIGMIENYFIRPEILVLLVIILLYFGARIFAAAAKKEKMRNMLEKLSVWVYLLFIMGLTLFNRSRGVREIRLMPHAWLSGSKGFHESSIIMAFLNMALYVPYGYLIQKQIKQERFMISVFAVFATSFLVELLQYVFALGVTSGEDILMNFAGGCIGIAVAAIICRKNNLNADVSRL